MHDPYAPSGQARAEIIGGLRQLADYLDQNPGVPVNEYGWTLLDFASSKDDDTAGMAEVDRIATTLGVTACDDTPGGGHYTASRSFGRVAYKFVHVSQRRRAAHAAHMSYSGAVTPDDTPQAA